MTDLERVARAICEASCGTPDMWELWLDHARAALRAIREPSEGMIAATNALPVSRFVNGIFVTAHVHGCGLPGHRCTNGGAL